MRATSRALAAIVATVLLGLHLLSLEQLEQPPVLDCAGNWAPKEFESPILVSSNRRHKAYTQIHTRIVDEPKTCVFEAELYVQSPKDRDFRLVLADRGAPDKDQFRSMLPVDWSPDERYLLVWIRRGYCASDNLWDIVGLYDVAQNVLITLDHVEAMRTHTTMECEWHLPQVLGFTDKGEVALAFWGIGPSGPDDDPCSRQNFGLWAVSRSAGIARRLPGDYQVKRYGTTEERGPKN